MLAVTDGVTEDDADSDVDDDVDGVGGRTKLNTVPGNNVSPSAMTSCIAAGSWTVHVITAPLYPAN